MKAMVTGKATGPEQMRWNFGDSRERFILARALAYGPSHDEFLALSRLSQLSVLTVSHSAIGHRVLVPGITRTVTIQLKMAVAGDFTGLCKLATVLSKVRG